MTERSELGGRNLAPANPMTVTADHRIATPAQDGQQSFGQVAVRPGPPSYSWSAGM